MRWTRRINVGQQLGALLGLGMICSFLSPWMLLSKLDKQIDRSRIVKSRNDVEIAMNRDRYPNSASLSHSCSELFGMNQLVRQGRCLQHQLLLWRACEFQVDTVWINVSRIEGSIGGEPVDQVLGRSEREEQLQFLPGSLMIQMAPSSNNTSLWLPAGYLDSVDIHTKRFLQSVIFTMNTGGNPKEPSSFIVPTSSSSSPYNGITLLVRRGNYANPCMALLTMYNVYILLVHFYDYFKTPSRPPLTIVWLDGHAFGDLDPVWDQLFGTQPRHIKELLLGKEESDPYGQRDSAVGRSALVELGPHVMVVNTMSAIGDEGLGLYGWNSQQEQPSRVDSDCQQNSTLVQFRDFVLQQYDLQRSVTPSQTVTLLVRRNYQAHPRSSGLTDRTLANLSADTAYIQSIYPEHRVRVVSFEGQSFRQQLEDIVSTDILVAVHGAGNIHVLFLPDHATIVEYVPKSFRLRRRFRFLAECLNVTYVSQPAFIEGTQRIKPGSASRELIKVRLRPSNQL